MRRVDVHEFSDRVSALINETEPLVLERRGQPVGIYVPLPQTDKTAAAEAAARLNETVTTIRERLGLSEEEFVAAFLEVGD